MIPEEIDKSNDSICLKKKKRISIFPSTVIDCLRPSSHLHRLLRVKIASFSVGRQAQT